MAHATFRERPPRTNAPMQPRNGEKKMENKLIKINSMETLENGFISVNADFELGHLEFWTNQCEIDRLIAGGNMERLTEDRYE